MVSPSKKKIIIQHKWRDDTTSVYTYISSAQIGLPQGDQNPLQKNVNHTLLTLQTVRVTINKFDWEKIKQTWHKQ